MDFQLKPEQTELMDSARRYAREQLSDIAEQIERTAEPPGAELIREFAGMGYLGINVPEALGGLGLGNLEALIVIEEVAKISAAVAFPIFESCVGPVRAIERFGSDALKRDVVPAVCRGERVVAIAMSEPAAGSALTDLTTRGSIDGDTVTLNGTKRWCSGGGHADGYLVYCRLSDEPGAKGIGAVYVPKGTAGMSFGEQEQLMGFRGVPSSDIYFDDVRVPLGHVVVAAGGFKKLMTAFDLERCGNATMCLAIAQSALDQALAYTGERKAFGQTIDQFQGLQFRLADMEIELQAARTFLRQAAWKL
ncbi:MAG: acyl-CoA dehydrogenase family protein, partial [Pseudomonadota bacterium]